MIKGVSRQIIEVNNTESLYFDKAVFYLKPGVRILPEEISSREIDKYLTKNNICLTKHNNFQGRRILPAIRYLRNIFRKM